MPNKLNTPECVYIVTTDDDHIPKAMLAASAFDAATSVTLGKVTYIRDVEDMQPGRIAPPYRTMIFQYDVRGGKPVYAYVTYAYAALTDDHNEPRPLSGVLDAFLAAHVLAAPFVGTMPDSYVVFTTALPPKYRSKARAFPSGFTRYRGGHPACDVTIESSATTQRDVLHELLVDAASAHQQSFRDWCRYWGYSDDSITAKNAYDMWNARWEDAIAVFGYAAFEKLARDASSAEKDL